jgi:hypothetical protein
VRADRTVTVEQADTTFRLYHQAPRPNAIDPSGHTTMVTISQ